MANIIFEIGDWSGDGHNYCAEFMVKTNKTLEEMREIHYKENEFIGNLCKKYLEDYIYVNHLYEFLLERMPTEKAMEFLNQFVTEQEIEVLVENDQDDEVETMSVEEEDYHTFHIDNPEAMLNLWLMLLKVLDDSVEYEVISGPMSRYYIKYKGYPEQSDGTIQFYGQDKQGRHLNAPGYGVWDTNTESEYYND